MARTGNDECAFVSECGRERVDPVLAIEVAIERGVDDVEACDPEERKECEGPGLAQRRQEVGADGEEPAER